jgi:hypothetical protein
MATGAASSIVSWLDTYVKHPNIAQVGYIVVSGGPELYVSQNAV